MLQCSKGRLEAPTEGKAETKQINANKKHGFRRAFVFLCSRICITYYIYILSILIKFVLPDSPLVSPPVITILSPLQSANSFSASFFAV